MYPTLTAPVEGLTNWKVFGAVMGGGLGAIGAMTGLVMNGMIALADAAIPVPFTVTADSISGTNFGLEPGQVPNQSDGAATVTMDGQLTNMKITKSVTIGSLGTFNIEINAGTSQNPVDAKGMTVYASSLGGTQASFGSGLTMDASKGSMSAPSINMTGATLQVPYLKMDSITLPNMSLSITRSGS